jgi:hypothetical protein
LKSGISLKGNNKVESFNYDFYSFDNSSQPALKSRKSVSPPYSGSISDNSQLTKKLLGKGLQSPS